MGARWAWEAVCPNLHVYGNFSGGADPCYECGAEPEVEFEGDDSRAQAMEYAAARRSGDTAAEISARAEVAMLHTLAEKYGYKVGRA